MQPAEPAPDRYAQRALAVAYHLRRYVVLYLVGALGAAAVAVFPTLGSTPATAAAGAGANTGGVNFASAGPQAGGATANAATSGPAAATTAGGPAAGGSGVATNGGGAAATAAGGPAASATHGATAAAAAAAPSAAAGGGAAAATAAGSNTVVVGAGTTAGGFPCGPNVRQLPFSAYAAPCEAHFTGNNGGATYNGVTAKSISIAVRHTSDSTGANAAATTAETQAAGGVDPGTAQSYIAKLVAYFNKTFELYGRSVQLVDYNGQGNGTNEELGQDQAAACADADQAANTMHAFGDIIWGTVFEYQPFSDCAARYHLYIPQGSAYFPESAYAADSPYVWATTMNCSLISDEVAEWIGKQIASYPAQWAGNDGVLNMKGTQRKFGTYVPNNAGYQQCVQRYTGIIENQYHVPASRLDQYNYALDISTFPQDAQRAIVQFASNNDTSVVMACDPISMIFLTQDAVNQNYYPEWVNIGVAGDDFDQYAQLWDQQEVTGRLFGLSQAGSTQAGLDPNSEDGKVLTSIGVPINTSSVPLYYLVMSMFNQLQAAGPDLTPANIAAGTAKLPKGGGETGPSGTWYFGTTHTGIIDSRQIYWDASGHSPNGKTGTYAAIYNGQRFSSGQFPTGQPPYYP